MLLKLVGFYSTASFFQDIDFFVDTLILPMLLCYWRGLFSLSDSALHLFNF